MSTIYITPLKTMIVDQGAVQYVNKQTNKLIQHNRLQKKKKKTTEISYD